MDKSRLDTTKGLIYKPNKSPQMKDSLEIISRSRNQIIDKSTSYTQSEQIAKYKQLLRPHLIHLTAIDPKRKKHVKSTANCLHKNYSNKSVSLERISAKHSHKPLQRYQKLTPLQKEEAKHKFIWTEKVKGNKRKSFDIVKQQEPKQLINIKKCINQERNQMLNQIMIGNQNFEDIFGVQEYTGKHQQIISTIPPGLNLVIPGNENEPPLVTGHFNIPDEDKVNTIKLDDFPNIHIKNINTIESQTVQKNRVLLVNKVEHNMVLL